MGDMPGPSLLQIATVYAVVIGLTLAAAWFPRTAWRRALRTQFGPGMDVGAMTRGECVRAAGAFALAGLIASLAVVFIVVGAEYWLSGMNESVALFALGFMYLLLAAMGFAGALYLLVRAPFRPTTLPVSAEMLLAGWTFLKRYESSDRTRHAELWEDPARGVLVVNVQPVLVEESADPTWLLIGEPRRFCGLDEAEEYALMSTGHIEEFD